MCAVGVFHLRLRRLLRLHRLQRILALEMVSDELWSEVVFLLLCSGHHLLTLEHY